MTRILMGVGSLVLGTYASVWEPTRPSWGWATIPLAVSDLFMLMVLGVCLVSGLLLFFWGMITAGIARDVTTIMAGLVGGISIMMLAQLSRLEDSTAEYLATSVAILTGLLVAIAIEKRSQPLTA